MVGGSSSFFLEREGPFNKNQDEARELVWYFLKKIQALKADVIVWPDDWGDDIWIVTVDGTHCWIKEPTHPDWSQDKSYFSHKYNKAGLNYELAIIFATWPIAKVLFSVFICGTFCNKRIGSG